MESKKKLQRVDRLRDFGLDEKVKLLFMLSFPVNDEFEEMLRDEGAVLELTDPGRVISYYRSADGSLERGVPAQDNNRNVLDGNRDQNGVVPAQMNMDDDPVLLEPKQEVDRPLAPNPTDVSCTSILFKLQSLIKVFSLPGLNKLKERIGEEIDNPRRENQMVPWDRIHWLVAYSHRTLCDGASINVPASDGAMLFVDFLRTYCQWLDCWSFSETRGIREVIQDMIREIKLNDSDGEGPKKRISKEKIVNVLKSWFDAATPA
ncbi:unnamed protein product [Caenorhabditis brenneri]